METTIIALLSITYVIVALVWASFCYRIQMILCEDVPTSFLVQQFLFNAVFFPYYMIKTLVKFESLMYRIIAAVGNRKLSYDDCAVKVPVRSICMN